MMVLMNRSPIQGDEHFRAVFEGAAIGISLTDVAGAVIGSNQCLQDMLGYSAEELHGMNFKGFTHPDDVEADWNLLQEMIAGKRTHYRLEKRYIRKDREVMWVRLSVSLVRTPDGSPHFVMAMVEDISARKVAEEALKESDAQKSAFLAAAAHDLRSPLTVIKGFAQSLQRQLNQGGTIDAAGLATGLARIESTVTRMTALINQLLDVTQIEMGHPLMLNRRRVDLAALVREVVAEYQHMSERCQLAVHAQCEEIAGMWDGDRLERVIANLLTNSIKYSPEGGEIDVTVQCVDASDGAWATLIVADHGLGIPAADLPHVFERFYRGSNVAGLALGTGVGLFGVRQIVEQHGGRVSIESIEGQGTTFTVTLPLTEAP
jgi:PAS domain S-box-containing protein